ncbi:hypothetical protein E1B28_005361 [Marasmius oreades]|uniref:Cytochrome P450 n=1 Tax=Marasmius oreades TaxID=181124 RepID=A0A9P7UUH5_9AGAR|nr:uncharacterized protein E1B28_005361 [Marasmius oreades]KAG7094533.1 hypothetical protein E1B28_005361 [Marasmius oreades]
MKQIVLPFDFLNGIHPWALAILTVVVLVGTYSLVIHWFSRRNPHIRDIQGPVDSASWLYGNFHQLYLVQPYGKFEYPWQEKYGSVYRIKGCFSEDLLFISDPAAVRYVLNDARTFDYPPNRMFIAMSLFGGKGLLALRMGGDTHRRIKNAFSPAFTLARLQSYIPTMRDIARKAIDKLTQEYLEKCEQGDSNVTVDIFQILQNVTSDIIGETGFGHKFNAVETDGGDEIARTHQNVISLGSSRTKSGLVADGVTRHLPRIILSSMLYLPTETIKTLHNFQKLTQKWSAALLRDDEMCTDATIVGFVASANKNQKRDQLSFDEISAQTPTLLAAGQETTSNTLCWALYELAKRPTWQDQIRKEINEAQGSESSLDQLEYLNAHIRETLRLYAAVPNTERVAFEDAILPLSQPLTTASGRVITQLPIRKGQSVFVGIASYNRNPQVWGPDADVFDPLRWLDGRCDSESLPGIGPYSNLSLFQLLTFQVGY